MDGTEAVKVLESIEQLLELLQAGRIPSVELFLEVLEKLTRLCFAESSQITRLLLQLVLQLIDLPVFSSEDEAKTILESAKMLSTLQAEGGRRVLPSMWVRWVEFGRRHSEIMESAVAALEVAAVFGDLAGLQAMLRWVAEQPCLTLGFARASKDA